MPQRLVTQQDLIDNPDLRHKGVSINQHYNFPEKVIQEPKIHSHHVKKEAEETPKAEEPIKQEPVKKEVSQPAKKAAKKTSKKAKK